MFAFLNTLILSALGLALIPVIIHLLNRRKSVRLPFSSLRFLKVLQKKQIRNIRIRQILLLILRTLILLLVVMAFARPAWRTGRQTAIEAHEKTSVILILDHSMSSGWVTEQGMVLDRIKSMAMEIVSQFREGDEATILAAPGFQENTRPEFTRQAGELKSVIQRLTVVHRKSDLPEKMDAAYQLMKKARNPNREIIILSDMQKNSFESGGTFSAEAKSEDIPVHWLFIDFSQTEPRNTGIDTVQVVSRIIEKTKPVRVRVKLNNHSATPAGEIAVRMFFNGKKVQQQVVSVPAGESAEFEMSALPGSAGYISGKIEIDDDPLVHDNQYYFTFFVPEQIRALLVQNKPSPYRFIELALAPAPQFQTPVTIRTVSSVNLPGLNWNEFDVIVFSNHPGFDDMQIRQMESFLKKGKGVFVIPGPDSDVRSYSGGLFRHFGMGVIRSVADLPRGKGQPPGFGEMNRTHILIQGIYEKNTKPDLPVPESPNFYRYWQTELSAISSPVIQLTNRQPLLAEIRSGPGRLLFLSSAIDLDWNDLPLRGVFPPLMHRSVLYLYSSSAMPQANMKCGYPAEFRIRSILSAQASVVDESGREYKPGIKPLGDETLVRVPGFDQPGYYRLAEQNKNVFVFSANHDPGEGSPQSMKREDLAAIFREQPYDVILSTESYQDFILKSRLGHELWKWIFGIVLILLIAELAIAQSHRFEKNK